MGCMNSEARKAEREQITDRDQEHAGQTEFCRSPSICRMIFDLSCEGDMDHPGQVFCSASTVAFTASTVSIRLAPVRFETSIVMAGFCR